MHELVVVHYSRGWKAALFYILDLLVVAAIFIAGYVMYQFYTLPQTTTPTPAEHITLPDSGQQIRLQSI